MGLLRGQSRGLLDWADNSSEVNAWYIVFCVLLVLFAGCCSGLTLGLLSLDIVDLEVLRRSGTAQERRYAQNIMPIVKNAHYLLVTLLLCNAAAMETLPIFLNKMVHESVAIVISVTAVLVFGEIIPQAVCSKHGLMIGSFMAYPVRVMMVLTAPISWPLSKLLDRVLGGEHASLFRRKQLKALVHIHSKDEGFGGKLTVDEIQVITGALDLTTKVAHHAMTPLSKAVMLCTSQTLDDRTIDAVMEAKPYSRIPVYRGDNRMDIVGLVLAKELLQHVKKFPNAPVSSLRLRPIPRMSALTPMYTLLKLFRSGQAHMAVLVQPPNTSQPLTPRRGMVGGAGLGAPTPSPSVCMSSSAPTPPTSARGEVAALLSKARKAGDVGVGLGPGGKYPSPCTARGADGGGGGLRGSPGAPAWQSPRRGAGAEGASPLVTPRGTVLISARCPSSRQGVVAAAAAAGCDAPLLPGAGSYSLHSHQQQVQHGACSAVGGAHSRRSPSAGGDSASSITASHNYCQGVSGTQAKFGDGEGANEAEPLLACAAEAAHGRGASNLRMSSGFNLGSAATTAANEHRSRGLSSPPAPSPHSRGWAEQEACHDDDEEEDEEGMGMPLAECSALPGEAIGIITLEDVIEELMQCEIVDETDVYVDNEQLLPVADAALDCDLPDTVKAAMSMAEAARHRAILADPKARAAAEQTYGAAAVAASRRGRPAKGSTQDRAQRASGTGSGEADRAATGGWQVMAQTAAQVARRTLAAGSAAGSHPSDVYAVPNDGDEASRSDGKPASKQGGADGMLASLLASVLHLGPDRSKSNRHKGQDTPSGPAVALPSSDPWDDAAAPDAAHSVTALSLFHRASSLGLGLRGRRSLADEAGQGHDRELLEMAAVPPELGGAAEAGQRDNSGHSQQAAWRRMGSAYAHAHAGGGGAGDKAAYEASPLLEVLEGSSSSWPKEEEPANAHQANQRARPWSLLFSRQAPAAAFQSSSTFLTQQQQQHDSDSIADAEALVLPLSHHPWSGREAP